MLERILISLLWWLFTSMVYTLVVKAVGQYTDWYNFYDNFTIVANFVFLTGLIYLWKTILRRKIHRQSHYWAFGSVVLLSIYLKASLP